MTSKIVVSNVLMALGTIIAQQTKPAKDKPSYICMSGTPHWYDVVPPSDKKVYDAANADCKAQYDKEQAATDKLFRETDELINKMKAVEAQSKKEVRAAQDKLCQLRTRFNDDGTDIPWCAGVAPRLDALQEAHQMCREDSDLKMCSHLIPLSMGKAYNVIKVAYEPGLFPNYSGAIVTLQGQDGMWEDKLLGKEKQFSEIVGFNARMSHTLTVIPKNDGNMTLKYSIPAGANYSFKLQRTFCNTIPSGYSLYFSDGHPPIRPQGWTFKNCEK
jgi:hypothetical protein